MASPPRRHYEEGLNEIFQQIMVEQAFQSVHYGTGKMPVHTLEILVLPQYVK